jgi:hypothetical protein
MVTTCLSTLKHCDMRSRLLLGGVLVLLCFVALSVWRYMPIYPDEIAFRLQLGRYIQDGGVVHGFEGLYPLCASSINETPFIFFAPAWVFSWLDLTFSPTEIRTLPFITVIVVVFLAVLYAVQGRDPKAAVIVSTAFIGVAGSGLVLARYEYVQILNIAFCLGAFNYLQLVSSRTRLRYVVFIMLLFSSLASIYSHVQGLLFVPLTLYLAYHLIHRDLGRARAVLLITVLLFIMAQSAIRFHNLACAGYPEIELFWARMTFNLTEFKSLNWCDWIKVKFDRYFLSFLYLPNYTAEYLPGIIVAETLLKNAIITVNLSIKVLLSINMLLLFFVTIFLVTIGFKRHLVSRQFGAKWSATIFDNVQLIALVLIVFPIYFLFIYDSAQNFYRSFFINFVIAVTLSLLLSRVSLYYMRPFTVLYFFLCEVVVISSLVFNAWWFTDRMQGGYEGPSISLSRDWGGIDRDVTTLVKDCDIDLSKGRIVLDDMTYQSLKSYPILYGATYLKLSVDIVKASMSDAIEKVRPNYAIARCDTLRGTSIGFQKSTNGLCCTNFLING